MKQNFLIYLVIISLIFVCTLSFVSADNQTDDLLSNESETVDIKSFESIQKDIDDANDNDTVHLEGYYKAESKQITVSKSLTFEGRNDAVLDANHITNIFYAPKPVSLTFKNLTLINSIDYAIGANMDYGGFDIHVVNCTFKNNYYLAIDSYGANLVVEDSIFEQNYLAIQDYMYPIFISNSTFTNNSYAAIQASDATITNSSFRGNGNKKDGIGALQCLNLKILNSEFLNNIAFEFGGAIQAYDVGIISISKSLFMGNRARYLGGAIYLVNNKLYLNECQFINNSASNGAAVYSIKSNLDVYNSNFTQNHADFATVYAQANTNFVNSTFKDNANYAIIAAKISLVNCSSISKTYNQWTCLDDDLNSSDFIRISINKEFITYYKSAKKLTVKLTNTKDNTFVGNCSVKVVLKDGKKTYTKYLTTDSKGMAQLDFSRFNVGRYNLIVSVADSNLTALSIDEIGIVSIYQSYPKVKAPKVKFKYKKSKYFKVKVISKKTKKGIAHLKLKLKVFKGKKYKIYKVKTNKKGVAKFNTKKLKRGNHKVIIKSANKNYYIYKKSLIRIK